jgi:glutathione S-transferase
VICEYLDLTFGEGKIVPKDPAHRIEALRRQALGDGLLDLLLAWRGELMRPSELQSAQHLASYVRRVTATLDRMCSEAGSYREDRFDIGDIALGCALSYIDFRFEDVDWRTDYAPLQSWHDGFVRRPSVVQAPVMDEP